MTYTVEKVIGGRLLTIETGKLAEQADGAVTVHYGDTVVLVTACVSPQLREGIDFLPLTVDYEERLYAAGKIPGGFIKREGRPTQDAVLAARLTDRPIRPLFPQGFRNDVQVVITVLSTDMENDPDVLAIIGASAALSISKIPFAGPVAAVRVGYKDGELVLNPTFSDLQASGLDLVVAGTKDAIMMVEAAAQELPESLAIQAVQFGQRFNQEVIEIQEQLVAVCGKAKMAFIVPEPNLELKAQVDSFLASRLPGLLTGGNKLEREDALDALRAETTNRFMDRFNPAEIAAAFEERLKEGVRANIINRELRPSGRGLDTIRPISCQVGTLPRTHGSGLFTRGQTQVLTIATLGSKGEEQRLDSISPEESKRFIHHYNFPPFSTGEVKRMGSPARREIGHGALAERALLPIIPGEEEFPYTIRLVSEVLSSNGSTSMASVCGSSLSLMDAGVPIRAPVAGIAMGLVLGDNERYAILTDIEGIEDHLGDMDFKVAGTAQGLTALQMDIKVKGITYDIMVEALEQARRARMFVLERMLEAIPHSRPEVSPYAPRVYKITIDTDKIRNVIGPGGKMIRSIIDETKVTIDISDDGTVLIGSSSEEMAQKAIKIIERLTRDVEVGGIYTGKVTRITNFGAFVEILPGKDGLIRIGDLADYHVASVEDVVKLGDEVTVMVIEVDRMGRINLSRRALLEKSPQVGAPRPTPSGRPAGPLDRGPRRHPDSRPSGPGDSGRRPQPGSRPGPFPGRDRRG